MALLKVDGANDGTGLRSTSVAVICASFSAFYIVVVLGCSTFCFSKGHACGGDGQIYYAPFLLFPFCLMTSVIATLTLCSRLGATSGSKIALAAMLLSLSPTLLAIFVRHEIYLTAIVFLLPVTVSLVGGAAYLSYALARRPA